MMQTSYFRSQFLLSHSVHGVVLLSFLLILTAIILMGEIAEVARLRGGCHSSKVRLVLTLIILLLLHEIVADACVLVRCKCLKGRNVHVCRRSRLSLLLHGRHDYQMR